MKRCVSCDAYAVAWCAESSNSIDDLICHNCGLPAASEVAEKIAELQALLDNVQGAVNDALIEDVGSKYIASWALRNLP